MRHGRALSIAVTVVLWIYFVGAFLIGYWLLFLGAGIVRGRRGLAWAVRSYARGFIAVLLRTLPRVRLQVPQRSQLQLTRGSVVVCNHLSFLDPLLLLSLLPGTITIVRPDFFRVPVFGWLLLGAGFLGPDLFAEGRPWIDRVGRRLQSGDNLLVFPEGTRKNPDAPPDYKPGVAGLYGQLGVACVPVALNSGLFWTGFLKKRGRVVIEFLPAIPAGLKRADFMRTLEERTETATARLVAEGRELLLRPHPA